MTNDYTWPSACVSPALTLSSTRTGGGYVKLAIELGVAPARINTIIDFAAAKEYGVKSEGSETKNAAVLAELAGLAASGDLEVPIAATFPLDRVRAAFAQLEQGHIRGKIVLLP